MRTKRRYKIVSEAIKAIEANSRCNIVVAMIDKETINGSAYGSKRELFNSLILFLMENDLIDDFYTYLKRIEKFLDFKK